MTSKRTTNSLKQLPELGTMHWMRVSHPAHLKNFALGLALSLALLLLTTTLASARLGVAPAHASVTGHQNTLTVLLSVARVAPSPKCAGTPSGCH
jgi:hypothetical protein